MLTLSAEGSITPVRVHSSISTSVDKVAPTTHWKPSEGVDDSMLVTMSISRVKKTASECADECCGLRQSLEAYSFQFVFLSSAPAVHGEGETGSQGQ